MFEELSLCAHLQIAWLQAGLQHHHTNSVTDWDGLPRPTAKGEPRGVVRAWVKRFMSDRAPLRYLLGFDDDQVPALGPMKAMAEARATSDRARLRYLLGFDDEQVPALGPREK